MEFKYRFAKIYQRLEPGQSGDFLIAYSEQPTRFQVVQYPDGKGYERPIKADCYLLIDLWLVQLNFKWSKDIKYAEEEKGPKEISR